MVELKTADRPKPERPAVSGFFDMAFNLCFSTLAFPDLELPKVVPAAPLMGYQGIELRTMAFPAPAPSERSVGTPVPAGWSCEPADLKPASLAAAINEAQAAPVCLSTSISLHAVDPFTLNHAFSQVKYAIDLASRLGCHAVRLFVLKVEPGDTRVRLMERIAGKLAPLLDHAMDRNVELWFENAGELSDARAWWHLTNLLDDPSVGLIWNPMQSMIKGESASVALPMMISRLRMVRLTDVGDDDRQPVLMGQGKAEIESIIRRLRGMGYQGWYSVEWNRLRFPDLQDSVEALTHAANFLKELLEDIDTSKREPAAWGKKKVAQWKAAVEAAAPKTADKADTPSPEKPAKPTRPAAKAKPNPPAEETA